MAELMKLIEANGAFKSDLMQSYLSSLHQARDSTLTGASVQSSPRADVNLNLNASTLTSQGFPVSSYPAQTFAATTPGNTNFGDNLNANSVYQSSTQFATDSLPSIVSLDNMTTGSPPNLNELNKLNLTSPGTRTNGNLNTTANINLGATVDTTENINANVASLKIVTEEGQKKLEPALAKTSLPDTNANNTIDIAQIISEVRDRVVDSKKQLIDQVTAAIVNAHMNTTINTFANVEAANERIQRETADMPDMSINGTNLWQHFMGAMLPEMTKVIKFCTKLPGFAEIDQEDKIKLIKQGCFEVMVARFCILIDHVKEEMLDPTLQVKAPRNMVQAMPMGPFLDQFFNVASQFNPLGLNDGEIGLFTAILMINPEQQGLTNQAAVSVLQQLFIQSLYLMLKETHEDAEQKLTTLVNLVPVFHKINEDHLRFLKMIKMKSPSDFEKKFPALHKELFDTC